MVNELLAPAGNIEAVKLAILHGADAVYCAGKRFGARSFINNLSEEEIVEAAEFVHLHGKRIYITLNTLIFEQEMEEVRRYVDFLYRHVDAIIVQDFGVVHYIRTHYPDFPVHISTQCSIHNRSDIALLKEIGVSRVVLARELTLGEIENAQKEGLELEVFIHGALCYCYSGMCYLSFYKGGRSGNRGSCAQPCRQDYVLLEDGKPLRKGALFSMKDLNTVDRIDALLRLGVTSLKIEGRAKSLEYLASAVKVYRKAIDDFNAGRPIEIPQEMLDDLYASYSREKTKGYIFGEDNKEVTTDKSVKHQGLAIGKVIEYKNKQAKVRLYKEICLNDGLRFFDKDKEIGITVTRIIENGNMVKSSRGTVYLDVDGKVEVGGTVYKTSSSKVEKEMRTYLYPFSQKGTLTVSLSRNAQIIEAYIEGLSFKKVYHEPLEKAISVKDDAILKQFSKTGGLPFFYESCSLDNKEGLYLPIPTINRMRGELLGEIEEALKGRKMRSFLPYPFKDGPSLFVKEGPKEITLRESDIFQGLINQSELSHSPFALHLGQIGESSIISPYFGVTNSEAISFFRNLSKGTIVLSYECSEENASIISKIDANLGYLTSFHEPLMVSKHCPVGKYYQAKNKHCGKCKLHDYTVKDGDKTYSLRFHDCTMFLLGKKEERTLPQGLVDVKME